MNNENIKEILDILAFNKEDILNKICSVEDFVSREQIIKLLDYTTNLQEENERLKEENNNKAMNDYAHAIDESWYRELYDDYKFRCEKAIEYIKKEVDYSCDENCDILAGYRIDELLNILQGEQNE